MRALCPEALVFAGLIFSWYYPPMNKQTDDQSSPAEVARRRDAGLLSALKTPPKPHSEMVGKGKRESKSGKS